MKKKAKEKIINNPEQWIITLKGDFIRIKDSLKTEDSKLVAIRQKLSSSGRFKGKTSEQISKERYDKVWEEVNFDFKKFHDWLYEEKNKDQVEIIKENQLSYHEHLEVTETMASFVEKTAKEKWRLRYLGKYNNCFIEGLLNEESGQIFYYLPGSIGWIVHKKGLEIPTPKTVKPKEKHTATLIFLHGTYGAGSLDQMGTKIPGLKVIHPYSPTLQYDMWHGSQPAPGGQCKGWINITGDAWKLMDTDVCLNNPSPKKDFEEADKIIHLDHPQLMRAVSYINEIVEKEIKAGIPPEKIFIAGYSQGGLLTLAVALTSTRKLGGFISLCGLLPRWDKLLVRPSDKNKETPILLINNTKDKWIPFWTGQKSYQLLKERDYNVEFKTHPDLGHNWKDEDVIKFLEKVLRREENFQNQNGNSAGKIKNTAKRIAIATIGVAGLMLFFLMLIQLVRKKK
jgi:predicted esterase